MQAVLTATRSLQNGAYWATPLSYVTAALLNTNHADFAETLLAEAIEDFKLHGIYEDVDYDLPNGGTRGVLNYTASATNVLWGAKLLGAFKTGDRRGWG